MSESLELQVTHPLCGLSEENSEEEGTNGARQTCGPAWKIWQHRAPTWSSSHDGVHEPEIERYENHYVMEGSQERTWTREVMNFWSRNCLV
jgi:hypothetical protein